ncbi:MAG: AAA family ATPase [Clostridiales bacterium]|nr:AAA family ATPase [Clostridiales bacterium]
MIIRALNYTTYGKIEDESYTLSSGLNIFYGENEAGKSTVFNSLFTLLYGFDPANREKHMYTNWNKNEILFNADIFENKELFSVERRLMSVPKLTISSKATGNVEMRRNETLPWIDHVSPTLFNSVFHITSEDLNRFEEASWDQIQEQLIFNYGTDYLNKVSDVSLRLEQDINAIWRKDKRGAPILNQKIAQIATLENEKKTMLKTLKKAVEIQSELFELDEQIKLMSDQITELNGMQKELRFLLPIKATLSKVNHLEDQCIKENYSDHLIKLSDQTEHDLGELIAEMDLLSEEIEYKKSKLHHYSEHELTLLQNKNLRDGINTDLDVIISLENSLHGISDELLKINERIAQQYQLLFSEKPNQDQLDHLQNINPFDMKNVFQKNMEFEKAGAEATSILQKKQLSDNRYNLIIVVFGLILFIVSLIQENMVWIGFIGMALTGFGGSGVLKSRKKDETVPLDFEESRAEIIRRYPEIKVPDYVWTDPSFIFFLKLEQLIALGIEENQMHSKKEGLLDQYNEMKTVLEDKIHIFGVESTRNVILTTQMLLIEIEKISEIDRTEGTLQFEISTLEKRKSALFERVKDKKAVLAELNESFEKIGGGDLEHGRQLYEENLERLRRIRVYKEELEQQEEWTEIVINWSKDYELSELQIAKVESEIERLGIERQESIIFKNSLVKDMHSIKEKANIDALDSELIVLREECDALENERDILMITKEIIEFSDERYRLENQPDLIAKVSVYMSKITNGKYNEIMVDDSSGKYELFFRIDDQLISVSKAFSKGTINQLFFAFRLAVIDAIDSEYKLPLILDDALVSWDKNRLKATGQLIHELSQKRQVFIMTCHPWMLSNFECFDDIKKIEL